MSRMIKFFVVLVLALVTFKAYVFNIFSQPGIDFYHFWGVPTALQLSDYRLGSPYAHGEQYAQVLNGYAGNMRSDGLLTMANQRRLVLDLTGSPLLYTLFAIVPRDYSRALTHFRIIEILLFFTAIALLRSAYRCGGLTVALLSLSLMLGADHLKNDLALGNITILLFFGLAATTMVMRAYNDRMVMPASAATGLLMSLVTLTLLKPLVLLPCLGLAATLWHRLSGQARLWTAILTAMGTAVLVVIPCLYFRSWSVWQDWYDAVYGVNHRRLLYPVAEGNFSFSLIVSSWLNTEFGLVVIMTAAVLAGSFVRARLGRSIRGLDGNVFAPDLAMAAGMVLTFALSPLSWIHYYLLLLVPALWLIEHDAPESWVPHLGLATLVISSGIMDHLLTFLGWDPAIPPMRAVSWVPLWLGILLLLRAGVPGAVRSAVESPATKVRPDQE
jgi:hypothetical protein